MDVSTIVDTNNIIAVLIGFATAATIVTLGMQLMDGNELTSRMKAVSVERTKMRDRSRLQSNSLLSERSGNELIQFYLKRLNADKIFDIEEIRYMLFNAGYRGSRYMSLYMFFSLFMPPIVLVLSYIFFEIFAIGNGFHGRAMFAIMLAIVAFFMPKIILTNKIKERQLSIKRAWPDALDLILICVESGMSMEVALKRVAQEIGLQSIPLSEELNITIAELSYLQDRRQALDNLALRTGMEVVKAVTTSLIQAEKFGTPLGQALRVLSQENRDIRMSEAEKKAAALPPKLSVPLIVFFLPVLFIIIMGPAIIQVMQKQLL